MKRRLKELWIELTADRKKAATLAVLLVIAVGAVVNLAVKRSRGSGLGPARASAREVTASQAAQASQSAQAAAAGKAAPADAPVVRLPELAELSRNIFEPNEHHFPQPAQPERVAADRPKSPAAPDEVSAEELARRAREETDRRVLEEAGALRLRSVMLGASPIAVMEWGSSGKRTSSVLRVGQEIAGFVLVEVGRDRVVVEKEGVQVEVALPLP